jgi:hypothetical protein
MKIKEFLNDNHVWVIRVLVGLAIGLAIFMRCSKAEQVKVERDTVVVFDTIYHHYPKPVDSAVVRYVTKVLPVVRYDTVHHLIGVDNMIHDTVAVEVPITSKHYGAPEYDAWVSGYEPSLDSIKVYQKEVLITERVTISKPPNKWELDAMAGIDYNVKSQSYRPYAGGELLYKPNRLQVGIRGGIIKNDKAEPFAGAVIKYRLH